MFKLFPYLIAAFRLSFSSTYFSSPILTSLHSFLFFLLHQYSAKNYLEEINLEHSTLLRQVAVEVQDLKESHKSELESLLKESENVQILHEKEKMDLSQRFQDLIQDLRNHDEEQTKIKIVESLAQRDAEFIAKEKVRMKTLLIDYIICVIAVQYMILILIYLIILIFSLMYYSC